MSVILPYHHLLCWVGLHGYGGLPSLCCRDQLSLEWINNWENNIFHLCKYPLFSSTLRWELIGWPFHKSMSRETSFKIGDIHLITREFQLILLSGILLWKLKLLNSTFFWILLWSCATLWVTNAQHMFCYFLIFQLPKFY